MSDMARPTSHNLRRLIKQFTPIVSSRIASIGSSFTTLSCVAHMRYYLSFKLHISLKCVMSTRWIGSS